MLTRLQVKNFTVFPAADFQFASGLNVIVGENGAGKTHVLKLAYTVAAMSVWGERDFGSEAPTKSYLEAAVTKKLRGVFRPDALDRLVRQQAGRHYCRVQADFERELYRVKVSRNDNLISMPLLFTFRRGSKSVAIETYPTLEKVNPPVYLPTRELLTIYPGFVSLYETTELPFEETWRDTCLLLGSPLAKGARMGAIRALLEPLEEQLGGKVEVEDGRFYVKTKDRTTEAHLVAEGLRKLAMIARLIANGSLVGKGSLFWDEPEANLNPKVIKQVARTILQLCEAGIQVFIASHSLFLLRELDILLRDKDFQNVKGRFFGLHPSDEGVTVQQGDTIDDVGDITSLQEELSQSDRYLEMENDDVPPNC